MAEIVRTGSASLASTLVPHNHIHSYLEAGEDLPGFDPCYIKSTDGKVYRSIGTTAGADASQVHGYPFLDRKLGQEVDLYWGVEINWPTAAGLTPGKRVYLSLTAGTAGRLSDTATTGGTGPIGHTIDGQRVFLTKSYY